MRKILSLLLITVMALGLIGCGTVNETSATIGTEHIKAEIVFRDYGTVKVELYPEKAPITVANFVNLVESGFYDGTLIHRIQTNFVIQGGDPKRVGKEPVPTIKGEFANNGVANDLQHTRGALSMARNGVDYDSASSQFFICIGDCRKSLDGDYACFGYVTEGMNVIDKIVALGPQGDSRMGVLPEGSKMPVIETIRIINN
ncbi:peptidyl-prolyl cis-trans isomerase B (cyclophilin B) [Ruminococcaceae bacterium YRB3002]|nr:peptidyl-prolyl cis-trans isomerase B (cyclophilin B) [Ruminococcaceae bacterium YRB3002]